MKKNVRKSSAVLRRSGVIKTIEAHMEELRRFGVRSIGLFGSYGKTGGHKASDMDFLVRLENPTFDNYMDLKFLLERLFHKQVDLVMEDTLKPALRYVKKEAVYAKVA